MSALHDAIERARALVGRPAAEPDAVGRSDDERTLELRRRRDALAQEVTELHWDLGGLAYEMAIRDHFRLDVLVRRAALLQQRDAELAELERLLRLEEDGAAGSCPQCGSPHSRGAAYCWQCGSTLMNSSRAGGRAGAQAGADGDPAATAVMEALFSPSASRPESLPDAGD